MGCGPCPELWSISRRTKPGGLRLALFDEFVDDWLGAITGFTHPLVEESLNRRERLHAGAPVRRGRR